MIGDSLGRYRLLEEVGAGGMGVVYRAHDERLDRDVAVKVLPEGRLSDDTARKRFRAEAKHLSRLNHPNIATVHDFDTLEGVDFLVMEYIAGETLEERLKAGALEEEKVLRFAMQLADALVAAHEQGVIHRDLKPGNLRITPSDRLKILDFGLARWLRPVSDTTTTETALTGAQTAVGTLPYMVPEQLLGESCDARTDMYAAGVVLYEMATGRRPFPQAQGPELITAILQRTPDPPGEVNPMLSPALDNVILKALGKQREHRYQSARELLEALDRLTSGEVQTHVEETAFPFLERDEVLVSKRPVFVAREEELATLKGFLETALSGEGRVVFVTGEAGAGKTSLLGELGRHAQEAHTDLVVASGNCNAHTGAGDPYLPFREVLAQLTGDVEARWRAGAITRERAIRLWHALPLSVQALVEKGSDLIDVFVVGRELLSRTRTYVRGGSGWTAELARVVAEKEALPGAAGVQQSALFEQYARVLETLAARRPLLLFLDDLQWADTGSLGLLLHLIGRMQGSRVLIVGAYRPEEVALGRDGERHPLKPVINDGKAKFGDIEVAVGVVGGREFVDAVLDREPNLLGAAFRKALYEQTRGHSLFTVELVRGMQEQGALVKDDESRWVESDVLDWETLPARVEATVGERIERLPEELREVLRLASVAGEVFAAEVVALVQKSDERDTVRLLSRELDQRHQLVRAQDIRRVNDKRVSFYRFKHILFQRYLYNSLDDVERSYLHEEMARAMEALYGDRTADMAVELAHHFGEAGITAKALAYLQQAAAMTMRQSAHEEAASFLREALRLLEALPETAEQTEQELALQAPLAMALMNLRGYADPEVGEVYSRAYDLCKQIGETPQIAPALFGLWAFHFTKAEYAPAVELAEQVLRLAPTAEDPELLLQAGHNAQAANWSMLGKFDRALEHAEQVSAVYDPEKHRQSAFVLGQDLKPTSMSWAAGDLWLLGYPDQGKQRLADALAFARKLEHPNTLAFVLGYAVMFHQLCRDVEAAQDAVEEELRLSAEHGFQQWLGIMLRYQGWIESEQGRPEKAIVLLRQGLAATRAIGMGVFQPVLQTILAEACARAEQAEDGLAALQEGLAHVEKTGERYYGAELRRVEGELLSQAGGDEEEIEQNFQEAIEVARGQSAKSFELRATMSLARLWQKQGKREEAASRLAEVYDWFTEGFDTADLKDAKSLLEALSQNA